MKGITMRAAKGKSLQAHRATMSQRERGEGLRGRERGWEGREGEGEGERRGKGWSAYMRREEEGRWRARCCTRRWAWP